MNVPTAIKRLEVYKSSLDQIFEKCTVDIDPLLSAILFVCLENVLICE